MPRIAAKLPAWLSEDQAAISIRLSPGSVVATYQHGDNAPIHLQCASEDLMIHWQGFLADCKRERPSTPTVVAYLPEEATITRRLQLPRAARGNLRAAAELQIDIETPFNSADVFYSAAVARDDRLDKQLTVELALAPAKAAAVFLKVLSDAEIQPDVLTIATDSVDAPAHNLLRPPKTRRLTPRGKGIAACAITLAGGIITAAYLPLYFHQAEADAVARRASSLASSANEVTGLFEKARDVRMRDGHALELKQVQPSLIQVLEELTAVTPDDTWIERLFFRGDQIQISGMTPSTSAYTDKVLANPMFVQPVYLTPIARDQQTNLERFSLSFKLRAP